MSNTLIFLIKLPFDIYLCILFIRLILSLVRAEISNPITQHIVKLTQFAIKPLKKIIPDIGRFETSTFVLMLILEIIKYLFISLLTFGWPNILGLILLSLTDIFKIALYTFSASILIQAIMSWIQPFSPMNHLLILFNSPILRPIQRIIPPVQGIDLSPIVALIIIQIILQLIIPPLAALSLSIAFG